MKLLQYDDDSSSYLSSVVHNDYCLPPHNLKVVLEYFLCKKQTGKFRRQKFLWLSIFISCDIFSFLQKCPTNTSVVSVAAGSPRRFAVGLVCDDQTVSQTDLSAAPPSFRDAGITISNISIMKNIFFVLYWVKRTIESVKRLWSFK